jgi:hypothetical protein
VTGTKGAFPFFHMADLWLYPIDSKEEPSNNGNAKACNNNSIVIMVLKWEAWRD